MRTVLLACIMLFGGFMYAQTTVTGKVTDQAGVPIPGANVVIVGKAIGAVADFDGNFSLSTSEVTPPFQIKVSSIGFKPQTVQITSNNQNVNVQLEEEATLLGEIVISASRTPERIFESPVSVERLGIKEIKNTASADFYDGLENLKGVDVNTNSLTFKSVNTRGFATFANTRFMQLVDGMDNSTPALNFPIGNLVGMIETDVQSVELLPGASSALYGANAFNGILFMRSKSPFDAPGISAHFKQGITSQEAAGDNSYTDLGVRAAYKFSDKFAAKVNFGYLKGTDWAATNETDKFNPGTTRANPNYDGINVYGDEVSTTLNFDEIAIGLGLLPPGTQLMGAQTVSRTGYNERDLTDYEASSVKADWGLYYRPWENDFEVSYVGKVGTGTTIYQGINRYNIDNFFQQQHKLEFKNDNFFLRGYVVADKAGDSYDMTFTGVNINRDFKGDIPWFQDYAGAYIQTYLTILNGGGTPNSAQIHQQARAFADIGRFMPGTPEFQNSFNKIIKDPDLTSGSKFQDASRYYHADANYNFSHLTSDFADIQVGGSYRKYHLNSSGTIYTDVDGPIRYSEVGVYTQIQKKFLEEERLKLTASVRYDKSELFDGFFSPRVSLGYTAGAKKNHNIRASFQTGFRNPTTQDLYIGLDAGRGILVGSAEDNPARDVRAFPLSTTGSVIVGMPGATTINVTGEGAYNNSFTASSAEAFAASAAAGAPNPALLQIANPQHVQPEQVTSFEVGYRASLNKVSLDLSAYYNSYQDFISTEDVVVPFYGDVQLTQTAPTPLGPTPLAMIALGNGDFKGYQAYTNSDADVSSYGASVGLSAKVFGNFDLGANYTYAHLELGDNVPQDFNTNFNTPDHKVKATFGNTELFKNFGFNVAWRWSDNYKWEASFGDGAVPAYHVLDAQVNLRVPSMKSTFKVGATNLLGDEYFTAFGTGFIGSQYYVSWTINNL